jgi:hypothetical protein
MLPVLNEAHLRLLFMIWHLKLTSELQDNEFPVWNIIYRN